MTATLSPIETVFDLARSEIERREHADENCDGYWESLRKARGLLGKPTTVLTGSVRPDADAVKQVMAAGGAEVRVGTFATANAAYRTKSHWLVLGCEARTHSIAGEGYAVFARTKATA